MASFLSAILENKWIQSFKQQQENRFKIITLTSVDKTSSIFAKIASYVIFALMGFGLYIFLLVNLAVYLSNTYGILWGFAYTSLIQIIVIIFLVITRKRVLQYGIYKIISSEILREIESENESKAYRNSSISEKKELLRNSTSYSSNDIINNSLTDMAQTAGVWTWNSLKSQLKKRKKNKSKKIAKAQKLAAANITPEPKSKRILKATAVQVGFAAAGFLIARSILKNKKDA
ncbi:MAG: hypothetical protein R2798_13665 [Chitinophagales bacterium]|nr:hypothetical protein [Bacteroidota bacterium]MCB9044201.1 hypothetical protein [Chitinophagales bacterium]